MLKNFAGKDGFVWFQGVVEDRKDPLKLGRARVRCIGFHTEDKNELPTDYLPWACPIIQVDHNEHNVGLREGDWVVGFFRDGIQAQDPIIMGICPAIPEKKADPTLGFNDPTPDAELSNVPRPPEMAPIAGASADGGASVKKDPNILPFSGTTVGVFEKEYDPKSYPFDMNKDGKYDDEDARLLSFDANRDGVVDKKENEFLGTDFAGSVPLSRYPLENRLKEPTTNVYERGIDSGEQDPPIVQKKKSDLISLNAATHESSGVASDAPAGGETFSELATPFAAKYPYNHAELSESGNLHEVDDTPGKERVHRYHRSGTYDEIHPDGNWVMKTVRSFYKMAKENFFWGAKKAVNISAGEALRLLAGQIMNISSGADMNLTVSGGNINLFVKGGDANVKIVGGANIVTEGKAKLHSKDDLYLIIDGNVLAKVKGNWLQDVEGVYQLSAAKIDVQSKSNINMSATTQIGMKALSISEVAAGNISIAGVNVGVVSSTALALAAPNIGVTGAMTGLGIMAATSEVTGVVAVAGASPVTVPTIPTVMLDNAPDIKEDPAAENVSEILPGYILDQAKSGDLWKPISDSDGNAVSLSNSPEVHELYEAIPTGELETVDIKWFNVDLSTTTWTVTRPKHIKGKLIERARPVAVFGDGRTIFRWKHPGAKYGGGVILKNGINEWLLINAAERHD